MFAQQVISFVWFACTSLFSVGFLFCLSYVVLNLWNTRRPESLETILDDHSVVQACALGDHEQVSALSDIRDVLHGSVRRGIRGDLQVYAGRMDIEEVGPKESDVNERSADVSTESHDEFKPTLYVSLVHKHPRLSLSLILGSMIGIAFYAFGLFGDLSPGGFTPPRADSTLTNNYFSQYLNMTSPTDLTVLMSHPTWTVDDAQFIDAANQVKKIIAKKFGAKDMIDPFGFSFLNGLVSTDRHMALLSSRLPSETANWVYGTTPPFEYKDFVEATKGGPLSLNFGGNLLAGIENSEAVNDGLARIESGSVPVLLVLLVFAFNGAAAVTAPLLLIVWTIIFSFLVLRLVAIGFHVSTYSTQVCAIFGAGLGMDYSLFMHLRFLEEMRRNIAAGMDDDTAVLRSVSKTLETSGRVVAFSGALLGVTLSGALQFSLFYASTMSLAIMLNAVFAAIGANVMLPALYFTMGKGVFYLSTEPLERWVAAIAATCFDAIRSRLVASSASVSASASASASASEGQAGGEVAAEAKAEAKAEAEAEAEAGAEIEAVAHPDAPIVVVPVQDNVTTPESQQQRNLQRVSDDEDEEIRKKPLFRFVMFVMAHPWVFALGCTAFFVAFLAVFFTRVQFANQSIGNFGLDSPTRYQYETMQARFPPSSGSTSVTVWLQTTAPQGIRKESFVRALDSFSKLVAVQPNVASVTGLTTLDASTPLSTYISLYSDPYNANNYPLTSKMLHPFGLTDFDQVTRVEVALSITSSSKELGKSVRAVRAALESSFFVDGTKILQRWGVAGEAAEQYDSNKDILDTIPNVIAVIVVGMYVLVLLLTGSILLPIKSIICAALSVCASFGILVQVVQEGNGSQLLQFRNNFACLDPIQLVFIFVVSFGLSLDYEVFMLGRIQEVYEQTGDTHFAVAKGVQTSARAITIAAVLLCTAVGGFLSSEVLVLKQIGIGIGLTIVMDATLMRCVLVPAYMAIFPASWNWYAPEPVKRIVAFLDFKEKS